MKTRCFLFLMLLVVVLVIVMAGCSGSKANTSSTSPTTTSTSTSTTPGILGDVAIAVKRDTHPDSYKTVCLLCHAEGMGTDQYPLAPTWAGSALTPGPWQVVKGSPADHTGFTDISTCLTQAGCHVMGK